MPDIVEVEVRCPVGPRRLFTKVGLREESMRYLQPQNWIEFSCSDCGRRVSKETGSRTRVYHRYNFVGELVETVTSAD